MLWRGELSYVVARRKIDPAGVADLIEGEFASKLLGWLRAGLLTAPRPQKRYGHPAPLLAALPVMLVLLKERKFR